MAGKLTKLERKTLVALITGDVHNRDITKSMADEKVDTIKIASGSRRLIVDFAAFIVDVYKANGDGIDHDLESAPDPFTHGGYVHAPPNEHDDDHDHSNSMSETVNLLTVPLLENSDEDHDTDSSVATVVN